MISNKAEVLNVLSAPLITEKSTNAATGDNKSYAFKVLPSANKHQIKSAVEIAFKVEVKHVRTCNVKGKSTRFGRVMGKHSDWKKAYVTLAAGHTIELSE